MLRPLTRAGNRRYYRAADVALVATIDRLVNRDGYTIRGARQALEGGLTPDAVTLAPSDEESPEDQDMAESPLLEVELVAAIARLRVHLEDIRGNLADALEEA